VRALGRRTALRKRRRKQPLESPVSKKEYAMGQLTTDVHPFRKAESIRINEFFAKVFRVERFEFEPLAEAAEQIATQVPEHPETEITATLDNWLAQSSALLLRTANQHLNMCSELLVREDIALTEGKVPTYFPPAFHLVYNGQLLEVAVSTTSPVNLLEEICQLFPAPELPPQTPVEEAVSKIVERLKVAP